MRKLMRNLVIVSVLAQAAMLVGWWTLSRFLNEVDPVLPEDEDWFKSIFDDYEWDDFYDPA